MNASGSQHKPRIMVAMSGGVDSSVTALLLRQKGYDVEALHMTNWDGDDEYCSAAEDLQDAREVCRILDIPLHHVNFSKEYRDQVFAGFLADYQAGLTPNPDVLCNREIKFGVFLEHALRLGADKVATGHYARIREKNGQTELLCSVDAHKDQTYFLHAVGERALGHTLFPLGELQKPEVRRLATRHGLPTRHKKDSTGICFIGERPFREFLSRYVQSKSGALVTTDGKPVGTHAGAVYYTIGQRKGLGIGGVKGASDEPWYVADRSVDKNTVTVVQGEEHPLLWGTSLRANDPNWVSGSSPLDEGGAKNLQARIRHGQALQPCHASATGDGEIIVDFLTPQWAIAPGQFVVFYDGEVCLGGARITNGELLADAGRTRLAG